MSISNYIYTLAGMALCSLLAGCQQDEIPTPQPAGDGTVITFNSPYTVDTRSAAMRYGSFQQGDKVGVLGFCKDQVQGNSDAAWDVKKQFCTPDVFYNQMLTYDGVGSWNYEWTGRFEEQNYTDELHPWSSNEDDTFSFFAYYPYAEVHGNGEGTITLDGVNMGEIKLSADDHRGDPTITYTMPHNDEASLTYAKNWWVVPDLMLAYKTDHRKADGTVTLNFRHLFCAFEFEVRNYNAEAVTIEELYLGGGIVQNNVISEGFYKSLTVTGQQSGYSINESDLYMGRFKIVGRNPDSESEDKHVLVNLTCPAAQTTEENGVEVVAAPSVTPVMYNDSPIDILFIPDENGYLTSDRNESLYINITATTESGEEFGGDYIMNLGNQSFQPGVRSIFSINIIGNDFYIQMRSDGAWEDDGDSDIVFE